MCGGESERNIVGFWGQARRMRERETRPFSREIFGVTTWASREITRYVCFYKKNVE